MFKFKKRKIDPNVKNLSSHKKLKIILIIILLILTIVILLFSGLLNINKVIFKGNLSCASHNQIKETLKLENKNIFLINEEQIKNIIKNKVVCLKDISLKRNFPNEVELDLIERETVAVVNVIKPQREVLNLDPIEATNSSASSSILNFETSGESLGQFLIDNTGLIFAKLENQIIGIPYFYIEDEKINIGKNYSAKLINSLLDINHKLTTNNLNFEIVKVSGNKVLVEGSPRLVFSLRKDLNSQFASLQLILQKATMDSKGVELIDLRFDKPVVVFSAKKQ